MNFFFWGGDGGGRGPRNNRLDFKAIGIQDFCIQIMIRIQKFKKID